MNSMKYSFWSNRHFSLHVECIAIGRTVNEKTSNFKILTKSHCSKYAMKIIQREKLLCSGKTVSFPIAVWLKRVSRMCLISIFCCCHVLAHIFLKLLQMVFHVTFSLCLSLYLCVYFARLVLRQLYRCTEWTLPKEWHAF